MDDLSNIKTVELTTAVAASEEEVAQFVAGMKNVLGCEVRVTPRTNPDILGGAIARVDSLVYDGSVRAQLDRLRAELVKEN
jgi:F-type H+-transporting ATPase subunit delta